MNFSDSNSRRPPPDAVYLDYQATTPVDPRVVDTMLPWFTERFGNPHSTGHGFGREAADAVEAARAQIATLIGAEPREIIFTSGATESNNLAIKGAARFLKPRRNRIVTLATEHKCVLESVRSLAREGCEVEILPVMQTGLVDLDRLAGALDDRVALLSVMAAHNEIGVLQDLAAIGAVCRERGVLLHSDAAQAFGKIPIDVTAMKLDLLSISGHKIYAPKGIGALYVRHRPRVRLEPLFSGGAQERGLRSGTLSPALCVALGAAAALAGAGSAEESRRLEMLSRRFRTGLARALDGIELNGDAERRLPGNLNFSFDGVAALDLLAALPEIALSTGSACGSAEVEPSYVLTALGVDRARAQGAVRIGFGRFTTETEIDWAVERIVAAVVRLRAAPVSSVQIH
ncbi:MAG: aminotransferase class V-fold PLP-dependent enzyme [Aliidongia sp.]